MSANVEAMVREGINAFKAGRKDEARALLLKATELDQYNEQAWLWLSGLMDTPDDQRTCLENVLAINPNNERASQGLSYLTGHTPAGNVSPFSASSAPPSAPSPSDLSAPTSVEWGAPEPTPGWTPPPTPSREPSPAVLDDWVANLNLTSNDPNDDDSGFSFNPNANVAIPSTSPFGDFGMDDDDFAADGPFSTPSALNAPDPFADPLEAGTPAPARKSPPPARAPERRRRSSAPRGDNSLLYSLESTREADELDAGQGGMFGYIPPEIPPTRLPGTHERTPALLMAGMVLLIVLNVGAGLLVAMTLLT